MGRGYKSPNTGYNYSYLTYIPTYNYQVLSCLFRVYFRFVVCFRVYHISYILRRLFPIPNAPVEARSSVC